MLIDTLLSWPSAYFPHDVGQDMRRMFKRPQAPCIGINTLCCFAIPRLNQNMEGIIMYAQP